MVFFGTCELDLASEHWYGIVFCARLWDLSPLEEVDEELSLVGFLFFKYKGIFWVIEWTKAGEILLNEHNYLQIGVFLRTYAALVV